jgi:hypothetical protein
MSAYVVGDETINRILAWLRIHQRYQSEDPEIKALGIGMGLGQALKDLNRAAVTCRYPASKAEGNGVFHYSAKTGTPSGYQMAKSVNCLAYQCAEGPISETPLFKWLEQLGNEVCHKIVRESGEYEEAEWG